MSMRPRSHEIEDQSRLRLREAFGKRGWVVWDLYPDYGEDILVRIFTNSDATHYSFFVQAKSSDNLERYSRKDGIHYPIKVKHLKRWRDFWEPVILTIWDSKTDTTYWEIVQDQLQDKDLATYKGKEIAISIPYTNILNERGLNDILERTRKRIRRFERLSSGTSLLMKIFEERFGVKVGYDLDSDAFIINWSDDELSLYAFDESAALAREYASEHDVEPAGVLFAVLFKSVIEEMARRGEEEQRETLVFQKKDSMNVFSARENLASSMTIEDFVLQGFLDRYLKRRETSEKTEQ